MGSMTKMEKEKRVIVKAAKTIAEISEGVFSHTFDVSLWLVAYTAALSVPQSSVGQLYRAQRTADRFLHQINYETIKQGIAEARRRGFLKKTVRGRRVWPEITEAGRKRLQSLIPQYDEKRTWDGRMHIVTYDIPERKRRDRFLLREYLKRIGCARLQESVWVTPYNPFDILQEFVEEKALQGTMIVSNMGKGGSIGEEHLKDLIVRVYNIAELNKRYEEWLYDVKEHGSMDQWGVIHYLSILRDDPQLPFALLPDWWKGEEAHRKLRAFKKKNW